MKSFKKAFTLTEILVVMSIVGFVLVVQLITLMGKLNQYGASYYTVYTALKRASKNVLADIYCPDCYKTIGDDCSGYACPDYSRNFPTDTKEFCKRLAGDSQNRSAADKGFFNVTENYCSSASEINETPANVTDSDFTDDKIQFIASNSMKFYISSMHTIKDAFDNVTNFFVVYIDLNGSKNPNRYERIEGSDILPDIVPFAVTTKGEVIPMGIPMDELTYMSARVAEPEENSEEYVKKAQKTFRQAILEAWPSNDDNIPYRHYHFPYTLMYDECYEGSGKDCATNAIKTSKQENNCKGGEFFCRVSIDKYTTSRY